MLIIQVDIDASTLRFWVNGTPYGGYISGVRVTAIGDNDVNFGGYCCDRAYASTEAKAVERGAWSDTSS